MANEDKKVSEETENTQAAAESKPAETQEKVTESTEETAKAEEPKAEVTEKTPEAAPVAEEEVEETTAEAPTEDTDADPDGNDIVTRQKEEEVGRDDEDGDELNLYEGREEFDPANFDWEKFEHGAEDYNETERASLDEMYDDTLNAVQQGEVVKGTVVDITKKEVVVNINYKSEGIVTANEFRYNEELAIGDTVDVYVESLEDKNGQLDISHKTARMHEAWRKVNAALEDDTIITGNIKCRTKGGLIADVFGLEAFLPGSQIDVKPIRDYDMYVGKKMEFKVVKINHEFKNVVVSHKALIEAELEEQKKQIIGGLEKGQVLEGTVKNITSYGVFIDLGGVDGLIHITDLSWGRINHPEEVVELDQKINVVILDFDDDKKRIALGLKQLTDHPWDTISDEVQVGSKVKGKVVVIADYGAFVEIAPGVEGLVHVSEMSWSQHLRSAQDFLNVGDEIDTVVLSIDREERKMSLGIKQLMPDPWASIVEKYPVGSKHKATVRNFTNFGIFVELEEGIDGLVHISDLSWSKKIKHPSEFCNIGDELEVVVLEVDQDNRRLSLGHKQLEENPWDVFESVFLEGSTHEGTVTSIENNTATIAMPYGVEAVAPAKHLLKADGSSIRVDERAEFVVLEFNKNQRRIMVSHTRTFEEDPKLNKAKEAAERKASSKAASKAIQNIQKGQEKTTLGDLDVLAGLKNEMEKDEKAATAKADKKSKEDKEEKS
ncbi:30S ribosomal protein S1 [Cryomorphaceae bacterium 1068]|nr:30S ribosomal protein S1 [Cryomorphaceae bacterium 1068]